MKLKKRLTGNNIIILVVSILWALIALSQLGNLINKVFDFERISMDDGMAIGQNVFLKEYAVDIFYMLIVWTAVFLFARRKKAGWILLAICMVWRIATDIVLDTTTYIDYVEKINLLNSTNPDTSSVNYWPEFLPVFILSLCKTIARWIFLGALLWLVCLKRIRSIYGINARTALLTICITVSSGLILFLINDREEAIKITQVESDRQVVVRYSQKQDRISTISFPFAFEFRNYSLKNRYISSLDYPSHSENRNSGFGILLYEINGKLTTHYEMSKSARLTNVFKSHRIVIECVRPTHAIDSASALLTDLQPYLEQIKMSDADTLSIGTIREFTQNYPQLAKTLLQENRINIYIPGDKKEREITVDYR